MKRPLWRRPGFWLTLVLLFVAVGVLFPVYGEYFYNPPWVVRRLPDRIKLLRPGMTHEQVWAALGVRPFVAECGGGRLRYHQYYPMPGGNDVSLTFDYTQNPARLVTGRLVRRH